MEANVCGTSSFQLLIRVRVQQGIMVLNTALYLTLEGFFGTTVLEMSSIKTLETKPLA